MKGNYVTAARNVPREPENGFSIGRVTSGTYAKDYVSVGLGYLSDQ
jgi:hypothetical protein